MTYFLIIKGTLDEAAEAARQRQIKIRLEGEVANTFAPLTKAWLEENGEPERVSIGRLIDWFGELTGNPPFPPGTLLWYKEEPT